MVNRAPSFVVVGLLLITLLLGFFYMSCSSKMTELQRTVDDFESRIRVLMVKNTDKIRELDVMSNQKRSLEDEKSKMKKDLDRKDKELNDLNSKLNERLVELRNLKADKQVLDERLQEYRNTSNALASRNFDINRLKQELDERKKSNELQLSQLKDEINSYKNRFNNSKETPIEFVRERFRPLLSSNETKNISSSFIQEPLVKLSNLTNEIKNKLAPVVSDMKNKFSNILDSDKHSNVDQNIPAPPVNNDRERGARGFGREPDNDNEQQDNIEMRQRRPRSFNDSVRANKHDIELNNSQKILHRSGRVSVEDANIADHLDHIPSQNSKNRKNYRIADSEGRRRRSFDRNDQNEVIQQQNRNHRDDVRRGNIL